MQLPSLIADSTGPESNSADPRLCDYGATAAATLATVSLAACGGQEGALAAGAQALTGSPQAAPDGFAFGVRAAAPDHRRVLVVVSSAVPTIEQLFKWAQRSYPDYFPGTTSSQSFDDIRYRAYANGNHLGVRGTEVLVLGPISGGALLSVGRLADFPQAALEAIAPDSDADAVRFLLQVQFSAADDEIAAVRTEGCGTWLARQLALPRGETAVSWMLGQGYDTIEAQYRWFQQAQSGDYAIWNQILCAPDPVRLRAALALSEFFCPSTDGLSAGYWHASFGIARYWDQLCEQAFGNFRSLLETVSLDPVIGMNLNTRGNEKEDPATGRVPDENYAREVMQLFTIGLYELNLDGTPKLDANGQPIETYGNADVVNLARVFTGYDVDWSDISWTVLPGVPTAERGVFDYRVAVRPMILNPHKHSLLEKRFLGTVIPAGTDAATSLRMALDALYMHSNVGPFFARQMIQRLVTSHPSPSYVERVARVFNDNGSGVRGDLRAVFSAVWLDDEARDTTRSGQPLFGKLSEPMLRLAQWARTFASDATRRRWRLGNQLRLFQSPLRSSTVFNFFRPGYVPPASRLGAAGITAPEFQITHEISVSEFGNVMELYIRDGVANLSNLDGVPPSPPIQAEYSRELALAGDTDRLLDRLNLVLCAGRLSQASRAIIHDALGWVRVLNDGDVRRDPTLTVAKKRVQLAVFMVMISPDYVARK